MEVIVHTDGGSRGNPGPSAIGVVIESPTSTLANFGLFIGQGTNNEAEYKAVIAALDWVVKNNISLTSLDFYLDSLLVVSQLTGKFRLKHPQMIKLKAQIDVLLKKLGVKVNFHHIPRAKNSAADALVNQALDSASQL